VAPRSQVNYQSAWVGDNWKLTNRLSVNLGLRFEYYKDEWPEQDFAPNGIPALAGWTDARFEQFIGARTVEARVVANTKDLSPRVGFAYDLTGDNRTVIGLLRPVRWNLARRTGIAQSATPLDQTATGATSTATGCSTARPNSAPSTPRSAARDRCASTAASTVR
jgi:outer membrane receptor protein involved in Fe transport